jgi:hypothetical protein
MYPCGAVGEHPSPADRGILVIAPKRLPAGALPSPGGWETGALGRVADDDPKGSPRTSCSPANG